MIKQKSFTQIILVIVSVLLVFQLVFFAVGTSGRKAEQPASAVAEKAWYLGVLDLLRGDSASIITDNLPSVAGFVCSSVISYFTSKDNNDKLIEQVNLVNERVKAVQQELKGIINTLNEQNADAKKRDSRNTLDSFFNVVDTFTTTVGPLYAGYDSIVTREKDGTLTQEAGLAEEKQFYEKNLKNIVFGNGTSTGSLYLQLTTLMEKIVQPSHTLNKTLMEHYFATYEHLWAFEMQSYQPKEEFLGYVMASLMEGITLYTFQHTYEAEINKENPSQLAILATRWKTFKEKTDLATAYLKEELRVLDEAKANSTESNSTLHYASGKTVSKQLFVGSVKPNSNYQNYFTYAGYYALSKNVGGAGLVMETLDNDSFLALILQDYKNYKTNYKKADSYTMAEFLKDIGFSSDDWDVNGLYRKQNYTKYGNIIFGYSWQFGIDYYDNLGNKNCAVYSAADLRFSARSVIQPRVVITTNADFKYLAFVSNDGVLLGSYKKTFDSRGEKDVPSMMIYHTLRTKAYLENVSKLGKVW